MRTGLRAILTVPDRLPSSDGESRALATGVATAVVSGGAATLTDGSMVRLVEFPIEQCDILRPPLTPEVRRAVERVTGTQNCYSMILGRTGGGALVFVVQSMQANALFRYMFDTVGSAVNRQLSGTRAGIVLAGFTDISLDELVSTATARRGAHRAPYGSAPRSQQILGRASARRSSRGRRIPQSQRIHDGAARPGADRGERLSLRTTGERLLAPRFRAPLQPTVAERAWIGGYHGDEE